MTEVLPKKEIVISPPPVRARLLIRGAVQGVGFRPFVYRLATEMDLVGWVNNSSQGVFIEVEGNKSKLDQFVLRIEKEKPPRSFIQSLEVSFLDPVGFSQFEIRKSDDSGTKTTLVLPDIATCPDCQAEIFDSSNRRYLYPFTNCTNCGPRFTIIESLPYDRPNTTMKKFTMCDECLHEYENPLDRRFHAQPNACPTCGPQLELWDETGKMINTRQDALLEAVKAIRDGKIVAVKGLGGFHLVVDARNEHAIKRLRDRKHREEKPFALMFPSLDLIETECEVSPLEERLLLSAESPIVLLHRKKEKSAIAAEIAPNNPYLGVMLPYTPMHHILMKELGFPIVATSGNLSDEPICIDEKEAIERLHDIADLFLVHNRPLVRHVDDSIVRVMMGRELVMRRARGYAPLPIWLKTECVSPILAVGGHLKNTVALTAGNNTFISQHIGDLETSKSYEAFQNVIDSFKNLYLLKPKQIVCDLHPEYLSTKFAKSNGTPVVQVQHHYAHVTSCMAENELQGQVLGISWDGTGYGLDETIWGGEFLLTNDESFKRVATFQKFRLPGGTSAIKEPRRTAIGILYELFGETIFDWTDFYPLDSFDMQEQILLRQMMNKGINSPWTSSAGRLFDAVASIVGLRQRINFEGQAAMELEFILNGCQTDENYEYRISDIDPRSNTPMIVDWKPMIIGILEDLKEKVPVSTISAKFHNTLVEIIVGVAKKINEKRIVLTGGCFQNKYLTECTVQRLRGEGFHPYWHQRVPPNDGGIALGQVYAVMRMNKGTMN